jgi:hypothetical protein
MATRQRSQIFTSKTNLFALLQVDEEKPIQEESNLAMTPSSRVKPTFKKLDVFSNRSGDRPRAPASDGFQPVQQQQRQRAPVQQQRWPDKRQSMRRAPAFVPPPPVQKVVNPLAKKNFPALNGVESVVLPQKWVSEEDAKAWRAQREQYSAAREERLATEKLRHQAEKDLERYSNLKPYELDLLDEEQYNKRNLCFSRGKPVLDEDEDEDEDEEPERHLPVEDYWGDD